MDVHVLGAVCAVWIVQNYFFSPFCFYFVVSLCADYLCVCGGGWCAWNDERCVRECILSVFILRDKLYYTFFTTATAFMCVTTAYAPQLHSRHAYSDGLAGLAFVHAAHTQRNDKMITFLGCSVCEFMKWICRRCSWVYLTVLFECKRIGENGTEYCTCNQGTSLQRFKENLKNF